MVGCLRRASGIALLALPLLAIDAGADEVAAGKVAAAVDSMMTGRGPARRNEAVRVGDEAVIGKSGSLTLLFVDESVLTVGAGARVRIEAFEPGTKENPGRAVIRV